MNEFEPIDWVELIQKEIENYQEGSSEYIRVLCGYLYCIGNASDAELIKRAKYGINFYVMKSMMKEMLELYHYILRI